MDDKINILMVDDHPGKLVSYEAILEELGENLIKAHSASEALQHLLKTEIAVVLMDVNMPELDGFELGKMIHAHPRFQNTAIIFISGVRLTDLDRLKGIRGMRERLRRLNGTTVAGLGSRQQSLCRGQLLRCAKGSPETLLFRLGPCRPEQNAPLEAYQPISPILSTIRPCPRSAIPRPGSMRPIRIPDDPKPRRPCGRI